MALAYTEAERAEVLDFIHHEMRRTFGSEPSVTPGLLIFVRLRKDIVGSIAIQDIEKDEMFPIEKHYVSYDTRISFIFERRHVVQGSRWIATKPGVSSALLRAAFTLACSFGKRGMLIEAKPYSIRRLLELGVFCEKISNVSLLQEKVYEEVGEIGMAYYATPPLPDLFMIDMEKSLAHLK